jgi:hypothetical protein
VFGAAPASPGIHAFTGKRQRTHRARAAIHRRERNDQHCRRRAHLEFIDWPQRIGIDNLVVNTSCNPCQQVPEPPMLPTVALGLGLLLLMVRRVQRALKRAEGPAKSPAAAGLFLVPIRPVAD